MISVTEARTIIDQNTFVLGTEWVPLNAMLGRVIAEDIFAPTDTPPFKQSAMDGYACNTQNTNCLNGIILDGLSEAGNKIQTTLKQGTAQRIFTGAPLPLGANTVIAQEKIRVEDGFIWVDPIDFLANLNIREQGSQLAKGALAIPANTLINAGMLGFLAGLGITNVLAYRLPKIGLLIAGKELVKPGNELAFGQIYESNSLLLHAALKEGNLSVAQTLIIGDNWEETVESVKHLTSSCDIVLATGGISVGDFDFVGKAFVFTGVETLFYKVKQKPGKPLFYGKNGNTHVFGLPGNPGSVLNCFYQFVVPCIRKMTGLKPLSFKEAFLQKPWQKKSGISHFLKGFAEANLVKILESQESYKLNAFVEANCLVEIPEEITEINTKNSVQVFYFRDAWL
jgi:molybdopterin molybdotransferase